MNEVRRFFGVVATWIAVVAVLIFAPLRVTAQTSTVNQGAPGKQGAWPVTITGLSGDGGIPVTVTLATPDGGPMAITGPNGGPVLVAGADGGAVPVSLPASPLPVTISGTASVAITGTPLPVTISGSTDAGLAVTITGGTLLNCTTPVQQVTVVGATATLCPANRTAGTNWIVLCNERLNVASTQIKVRVDGVNPTSAIDGIGITLSPGDCLQDYYPPSVAPRCLGNDAGITVSTMECTRT